MTRVLLVAAGGALGSVARYAMMLLVATFWKREFPLATFLINISGSFALGFLATWGMERAAIDPLWRLLITTGFLGAYTTFSTFEYETQRLAEGGAVGWALLNVVASVAVGFAAVQLGVMLARR
ncbi:MAG TPA: fluoride efflux transporter CrcB [Thermoanaerobaculia bacterium]|jgi:CrcB protein|nr:fluoride efflux transporter CrcB [Thermoanaerobaculia bacterium]